MLSASMKRKMILCCSYMAVIAPLIFPSCGRSGEELEDDLSLGSFTDIKGSISPQSGSQEDLAGWVIALIDKESHVARMAQIDTSGLFTFNHVFLKLNYTIGLFSPSLILRGVLAHPASQSLKVWQYFHISGGKTLPKLIYKGLTITWQDTQGINLSGEQVNDADGDGIPEGVISGLTNSTPTPVTEGSALSLTADTDVDGVANKFDGDIDGDGLINLFDHNDDGDLTAEGNPLLDPFDSDANGDSVPDLQQTLSDVHFPRGAEWIMVKFEMVPQGTDFKRFMTFILKLHPNIDKKPQAVQIRDPALLPPILQNSTVIIDETEAPWDGLLLDNGLSHDSGPNDGVYGMRVQLKAGALPEANQAIAFQLNFGSWLQEFIFLFPGVRPLAVSPGYDSTSRTITYHNDSSNPPFGTNTTFVWIIVVYEVSSDGTNVATYTSQPVSGSETSFTLPDNILETGKSYKYKVIAQSLEKVTGHAVYKIESEITSISTP